MLQANLELDATTLGRDLELAYCQAWQLLKNCKTYLEEKRPVRPEGGITRMRAKTYARIFGAVLLFASAWKLFNHYTGVWSPFLFRQSAFDGDTVLALVGIAFSCIMLIPRETSWDLAIIVSLLAGFKIATKFLPSNRLHVNAGLGVVPDVLWCVYMIFCAVVMGRYSKRIARRELGSLNTSASAPTR